MKISNSELPHAKRGENESFQHYKRRMKRNREILKSFKRGMIFWPSFKGTYVREKRKSLGRSKKINPYKAA